ncbi:unnamed protein product [Adineta steineri]|uniref:Transmembrane protein n=1 Tax=Adineta steineri TaxID=433720 RepID=A0A818NDZ2_9BILA|nr:unnamed protein product [Adineta steineri]CAF1414802.1 unnamed protein product [Adineta steineri]CAF3592139.1 unnamed protein product [Adineta steineri]CAF3605102.1 unnamed protein product [Adineta steineri]
MNNYQITNLRGYFDQQDFRKTWTNIAMDIKIRKYDQLDNIPEFRQLPDQFQNQMRGETIPLNGDYTFFYNQQYFSRFCAILSIEQKEKYLALYQEKKPSVNTQALLTGIGIGSLFFIWNIFKYLEDAQKLPTTNKSSNQMTTFNRLVSYTSKNYFTVILTVLSPIAAYFLTRIWLSNSDLRHKQLVHACMLKKLESIANSG